VRDSSKYDHKILQITLHGFLGSGYRPTREFTD
jgi:hypothetical protein